MTETSIITIILALIAVGGTLGGTWLGRMLERSNETRKWRREHCLEAYTEVLSSCRIVVFEANKIYGIECESLEHSKQMEVLLMKVAEMYRAVDNAMLLGSQEVYKKLHDLTFYCGNEIAAKSIMCPKLSKNEWHKIYGINYTALFSDCRNATRNDLELFPKLYRVEGLREFEEELSDRTINPEQTKKLLEELKKEIKIEKQKSK